MNYDLSPKVSIIVPVSNGELTIKRCINSIYQNKSNIECIVVINNTTDNTKYILDELKRIYKSLHVIDSNASGVSEARNIGLNNASGEIIGFCDADDYYEPYAIDTVLELFKITKVDILFSGIYRVYEDEFDGHKREGSKTFKNIIFSSHNALRFVLNDQNVMGSVCNKFYKRSVINNCRFDTSLSHCEDTHFNALVLRNELKVLLANTITYNYAHNHTSATNVVDNCFYENGKLKYLLAFEKIKEMYKTNIEICLECSYTIYLLSIQNYSAALSENRKKYLKYYIYRNIYTVLLLYKHGVINNMKLLKKGILILLGIR